MQSASQELEAKTLVYWKLSQVWNGKRQVVVNTGEAMEMCSTILYNTNIFRPLSYAVDGLLQEIIVGQGNKRPAATIFILPIKNKA